MSDPTLDLPFAWGGPAGAGVIRSVPEDFEVVEELGFEPSGTGEHLLVTLVKRELNTAEVARQLARVAGLRPRDVSFAGLKDRMAVTTQTFSLHLPGRPDPDLGELEDGKIRVLAAARHHRKLRRGALRGNRFRLRVRHFRGDGQPLGQRLEAIAAGGVPNYFGAQRFGREGNNLQRAEALFKGELRRVKREQRGIWLSAARSWLFNAVLAERVRAGNWNRRVPGDVLQPEGSRAQFREAEEAAPDPRLEAGEVHPTGPLWGRAGRSLEPEGEAAALEACVLEPLDFWKQGLERAGLEMDRRPLRLCVHDLEWSLQGDELVLGFRLGKGSYATSVLRELVQPPHLRDSST
ncbi:MAG: tRNA pseudouridine(13) synthase TruD [Gammaproteobacteria bacterium]|nr:MAG: tRNA pseudouridine(13) synthase TruD [Gammaproteobacteria bacterium]RTZ72610.1 MAG: tRNA pseudouridine(13) synthase TruD [Gammaproteobacteria bacterium]